MRRDYTATDYSACRAIFDNRTVGMRCDWNNLGGANLSAATVDRLQRLRLVDGPEGANTEGQGELVRLSGLGVKTSAEAIRWGIT